MFKKVIAKVCETDKQCPLHGQHQDRGFSLCPECAGSLTPVYQADWPKTAIVYGSLVILVAIIGLFSDGMFAMALSPSQTVLWALGKLHVNDRINFKQGDNPFFSGYIISEGGARASNVRKDFVCTVNDDQKTCIWRYPSQQGDRIHFEITSNVPYGYIVYRGAAQSQFIQPQNQSSGKLGEGSALRAPASENMRLMGNDTSEQFVFIFGKKDVDELMGEAKTGAVATSKLDQITSRLAKDPEFAVLNVEVPHS